MNNATATERHLATLTFEAPNGYRENYSVNSMGELSAAVNTMLKRGFVRVGTHWHNG